MARGVNKVLLIGNVGVDPDIKYTASGSPVCTLSVATSESWKDKVTGEKQERTEWHRVVFFNKLGEIAAEYVKKGSKIYIEGSLRTRKWQDQQGVDKYTTEIVANEMQLLDSRDGGSRAGASPYDDMPEARGYAPASNQSRSNPVPEPATQEAFNQLDDDVPF